MTYVHLTLTWIGICVLGFSYAYAEEPTLPTPRETPPPFMLEQLGDVRRVVSTSSPQAQAWFDQGFNLLYGFNHEGASMSFLEATKYDPECAMAWWGVACANGPNINDPMMSPYEESAAYTAANRALELIETETSPANQALIKALEGRYVYPNPADRAELDMAYADRLRAIHAKMPYDLDLAAITAEAIMNTQPWEYWSPDGTPKGACEEFRGIVEDMIRLDPNHPAANHLYIHIMEASPTPWIAESGADRLYTLMPASGHMVHMPSHIWVQTGRYEESVECNRRGYELDDLWNSRVPETFSYRGYNAHNRHFLVYAAILQGQREASIETAWKMRETVPEDFANRLRAKNAEVVRSGKDYEASIQAAILDANVNGAIHLADGSWPGYIEPPRLVMEGYTVLAEELRHDFEMSGDWPSHVYLQAGVGGFAGAIAYMIRKNWSVQPKIIIVEPEAAPCVKQSINKGKICTVDGPVSGMGRLDCKTPSLLAFDILSVAADECVVISEDEAEEAVRAAKKFNLNTSPSGAAGLAALLASSKPNPAPLIIITENAIP